MLRHPVGRLQDTGLSALANMQQEGVAAVFLLRLASHLGASVLPCVEAPVGESTPLLAVTGARTHGVHWSSCTGRM